MKKTTNFSIHRGRGEWIFMIGKANLTLSVTCESRSPANTNQRKFKIADVASESCTILGDILRELGLYKSAAPEIFYGVRFYRYCHSWNTLTSQMLVLYLFHGASLKSTQIIILLQWVFNTKTKLITLRKEIIYFYCDNNTEGTSTIIYLTVQHVGHTVGFEIHL